MKRMILLILTGYFLVLGLGSCSLGQGNLFSPTVTAAPIQFPKIDRRPAVSDYNRGVLNTLGSFDPMKGDTFQIDLRSYDLSKLDLSSAADQLRFASFDDQTRWPAGEQIPAGFDWKQVMEIGKNPGLGVRRLHEQGITGSGVGIAILDQPLQVDHSEYRDQLRLYEEINLDSSWTAQMHGPAVASLAVGKTVGVAPGADLYFIADWFVEPDRTVNFTYLAQGIRRILEVNHSLPEGRKIRVISISRGYSPTDKGYSELMAAIRDAERLGVLVISVGMYGSRKVGILGLGRDPMANPENVDSFQVAASLEPNLENIIGWPDQLWIPIDARTTASPTGTDDYVFYGVGGISWAEPYLAGTYALACQVDPKITPDQFWKLAIDTGSLIEVLHNGTQVKIGPIINPSGLIKALQTNS